MKKNKIGIIISVTTLVLFFGALYYKEYYAMKENRQTCAKFVFSFRGKSTTYFVFRYKVKNKFSLASVGSGSLKTRDQEFLKSLDCIEIVYSKSDPTNIRIIDKRIGNEWIDWSN